VSNGVGRMEGTQINGANRLLGEVGESVLGSARFSGIRAQEDPPRFEKFSVAERDAWLNHLQIEAWGRRGFRNRAESGRRSDRLISLAPTLNELGYLVEFSNCAETPWVIDQGRSARELHPAAPAPMVHWWPKCPLCPNRSRGKKKRAP